jgi:hypothetical protein
VGLGIQGALIVGVILEFLSLWDLVRDVILQPGVEDSCKGLVFGIYLQVANIWQSRLTKTSSRE